MASVTGKTAGIIVVGDEILKGQVHDINSFFMCKRLRAIGTKVARISVVEDNIDDIAETVKDFSKRYDIVLTTGGIGPTHDDVTYRGIAAGFQTDVACNSLLEAFWNRILDQNSSESVRALSTVPKTAKIVWGKSETPFFIDKESQLVTQFPVVNIANVFIFPGVPQYMQSLFSSLEKEHFQSQGCSFYTGRIYLSVEEEIVVNALNKTVTEMTDCVFGSYPVVGDGTKYKTQITIEALSVDKIKAAEDYFKSLISPKWLAPCLQNPTMSHPVYKFLQTTADTRLAATLNKSIKLVEEAFDTYSPSGVSVSFNGGKDCTVLLHIVLAVKDYKNISEPLEAVYFHPANPFPEVEHFIKDTVDRYQIRLTTLPGPIKSALKVLVKEKNSLKAIFLGTRRTDPYSKDLNDFQMTDPDWTQVMRVNPLLDWSYQDIWTFLRGIAAPYCSLYDQGYTSLGNKDNTRPNPSLLYTDSDGSQKYQPAWMLSDDSVERNGRL
ncbi:FAD synthase-like [Macrosteles quadrilineatus]|uniref:FAD synthase-like n=1 Tax=Macrosteles quadrilineatus TaxID=74068 RepID=UPI0023E3217D|nr:FAD synthase-like [Macrosteles quadrilineatus]XP_054285493.1 FAD synthase-like [Macrosteles quadrilineatus]XP_054285494.1 FAD synthase-like [Macrosteles quadrilineatus]XP_054285495.1 FAD synthase-like [Macrosteles quadrilineatus]XP_054288800.1 FAD synthase-like [Macrosteles quadrilineatus]XP_054288801.1 FAD synthase-like [Macrosteles quadrilineatus]XP_054288803.1 FAD synthase-like [Macrosteles quadrilineatus]